MTPKVPDLCSPPKPPQASPLVSSRGRSIDRYESLGSHSLALPQPQECCGEPGSSSYSWPVPSPSSPSCFLFVILQYWFHTLFSDYCMCPHVHAHAGVCGCTWTAMLQTCVQTDLGKGPWPSQLQSEAEAPVYCLNHLPFQSDNSEPCLNSGMIHCP